NEQIIENIIEIATLTDKEVVSNWAAENKIARDAIKRLFKEGFTSMEAMLLIEEEDLARTKIPRGQQKLILSAVTIQSNLTKQEQNQEELPGDVTAEEFPAISRDERISREPATSQSTIQHGGTQQGDNRDAFSVLLGNLQAGQTLARNSLVINNTENMSSDSGLPLSGANVNMNNGLLLGQSVANIARICGLL
ncbi:MAG: hypothetical protein AB2693_34155, partial [Candidatus Thiodiazotropha sp.]